MNPNSLRVNAAKICATLGACFGTLNFTLYETVGSGATLFAGVWPVLLALLSIYGVERYYAEEVSPDEQPADTEPEHTTA